MNTPFIPESPSQAAKNNRNSAPLNESGRSSRSGGGASFQENLRASFSNSIVNATGADESLMDLLNEEEEEYKTGRPASQKASSDASGKLLAQVREQFKKKETGFKS